VNFNFKFHLALLAAAMPFLPGNTAGAAAKYVGRCDVVFAGDSTLDKFTGDITNVPLTVLCETNTEGRAVLNTRVEISPLQLVTHNGKRDANMYKMFQPDSFPKLILAVTNAPLEAAHLAPAKPSTAKGVLPVQLTICGIARQIQAVTTDAQLVVEGWEFELDTNISLKDFKLKPPSLLLGAISVRDIVKVKAHVKLQKEPP
jgi:hypothetical protein